MVLPDPATMDTLEQRTGRKEAEKPNLLLTYCGNRWSSSISSMKSTSLPFWMGHQQEKVVTYKDHITGTRHVGPIHCLLLTALLLGLLTSDCFMETLQIHILFIPTFHKFAQNSHLIEMGNRPK